MLTGAALIVASILMKPAYQAGVAFTDPELGLGLTIPKTWVIQPPNKKYKDRTIIVMPIQDSSSTATLELIRTSFNASIDLWQTIQLRANEQLQRQVVRQWQQEILGVPMLLTRIDYNERGSAMSGLVGLFYTQTPYKLNFRLSAPAADYDKAEFEFNNVLETLHTLDGSLPKEEDPTRKVEAVKPKKKDPDHPDALPDDPGPKIRKTVAVPNARTIKPPVSVPITVSDRKGALYLPARWKASAQDGNALTLTGPEPGLSVAAKLYTTLDSDPPGDAIQKIAAASLPSFDKVAMRQDSVPTENRAGGTVCTIWRDGSDSRGPLHEFIGYVQNGDMYVVLTCSTSGGKDAAAFRKELDDLIAMTTIEPAP